MNIHMASIQVNEPMSGLSNNKSLTFSLFYKIAHPKPKKVSKQDSLYCPGIPKIQSLKYGYH